MIDSKYPNEGFVSRSVSSELIASDELIVDIDGFEGPLDLLLSLSRTQKLDLMKISILQLAEQYLDFIEKARSIKIELAADYLVMAAWLAFLGRGAATLSPQPKSWCTIPFLKNGSTYYSVSTQ